MKIVTGYKGSAHITSNDDQGRNQGIFGTGNYVLPVGNKLQVVASGTDGLTIKDGEGVLQGVHFRILPGTTDTKTITLPASGNHRVDYVVARYTKNSSTGVEDVTIEVVNGTAVPEENPLVYPTVATGSILSGDSPVEMTLAEVVSTNSGITSVEETAGAGDGYTVLQSEYQLLTQQKILSSKITANEWGIDDITTVSTFDLTVSNVESNSTKSCRALKNGAKYATIMINIQGFVAGTTEKTIATLPAEIIPLNNFVQNCISSLGNKYTVFIRANRNIGILPIDEVSTGTASNYNGWLRETITFLCS